MAPQFQPIQKKNFIQKINEFWKKGMVNKIVLLVGGFIILCVFCSAVSSLASPNASMEPTQDIGAIATEAILTAWAPFTQTALALPTSTPTLASTPTPTSTPTTAPTPTATPAPMVFTGSGDMIIDLPNEPGPSVLHAKYNGGGNFIIQNYDVNNQQIDLLVNTIGVYDGKVAIDTLDDEHTTRLQVNASGPWEIVISPITQARRESIPGTIQGTGDDVIILINPDDNADIINANASTATGNFIVYSYSDAGMDLVFNEIAPYTGSTILIPSTFVIRVKAEGSWSLDITTR